MGDDGELIQMDGVLVAWDGKSGTVLALRTIGGRGEQDFLAVPRVPSSHSNSNSMPLRRMVGTFVLQRRMEG